MTHDTINDTRTIAGNAEGNPSAEKGTTMDKSIGDGSTMRPKDECGGHGAFIPGDVIARRYRASSPLRYLLHSLAAGGG